MYCLSDNFSSNEGWETKLTKIPWHYLLRRLNNAICVRSWSIKFNPVPLIFNSIIYFQVLMHDLFLYLQDHFASETERVCHFLFRKMFTTINFCYCDPAQTSLRRVTKSVPQIRHVLKVFSANIKMRTRF